MIMVEKTMRFSIIVPIYNKECYVRECLESIRNQIFEDFECLMIDDGSTDSSSRICKEFSTDDDRFKYFYKENGGLVSARKFGAHRATGEYVINIDADDFIKNDFLRVINEEIERNSPDTVCFKYTFFRMNKECKADIGQAIGFFEGKQTSEILKKYLFDNEQERINSGAILFNICTKAVERELYIKSQEKVDSRITSGEDTVFTFVWCFYTKRISCIDYDGYMYRQEESSIEHTFNMNCFSNLELVCNEMMRINDKLDGEYQNNIRAYQFYRLERYVYLLAQNSKSMYKFLQSITAVKNEHPDLFDFKFDIKSLNCSNKTKYCILRNKLFYVSYLFGRTIYKGKLS